MFPREKDDPKPVVFPVPNPVFPVLLNVVLPKSPPLVLPKSPPGLLALFANKDPPPKFKPVPVTH